LRGNIEVKAAMVLERLDRIAAEPPPAKTAKKDRPPEQPAVSANQKRGARGWRLAAGGAFLLIFGLTLGVILTNSLRPRGSEQDSITGDFLTGTASSGNNEVAGLLREGKTAFGKQEFPKAIDSFKKVLAADPNHPEALAYMGFILMQAGHGDEALMAFDKALSQAPNFPMALWGKGMTLYQGKQDYVGAREVLEKLLPLVPPGAERNEIVKILAEIPAAGQTSQQAAKSTATAAASPSSARISGQITIDPKLKANVEPQAALFIIARAAGGSAGPPLAVKKIDRPTFPLSYSLGAENVMMQGMPFTGKVNITVRLDKDGNAMTRGLGDLTGDYKNNPVEVGTKNVDIVIDQVAQ
jgi:cytochrome c-type biogenesis protein CcmH/NrfG